MWLILIGISITLFLEAINQRKELEQFMDKKKDDPSILN